MAPRRARPKQLALELPTHGGARAGAGRKPKGERAGVSHHGRPELGGREPVHVTLRVREHVWNLRSRRCFRAFEAALRAVDRRREEFLVVHYSVQGNHVHLVVEADSPSALSNGVNALAARLAKGLNAVMGRRGKVFSDRFHAHVLRTPAETRNALAYVLGNFASHARRRGEAPARREDPFSSAAPVSRPRTWLLSRAERRITPAPA
jgi:putative transposase